MNRVYLRALSMDDLERTFEWHNNAELYTSLAGSFRPVSRETEAEWLSKAAKYSQDAINLAICVSDGSRHIGNIHLRHINWISRHAELHILIGDAENRSKGYGSEAVRLLLDYAFNDLGLNRVHLTVLADNAAAIKVYEKNGFVVEGRLRQHVFKQGQLKDAIVLAVCSSDYYK